MINYYNRKGLNGLCYINSSLRKDGSVSRCLYQQHADIDQQADIDYTIHALMILMRTALVLRHCCYIVDDVMTTLIPYIIKVKKMSRHPIELNSARHRIESQSGKNKY